MGMMGRGHFGMLGHEMLQNVDTNNDGALSQEEINAAVNARFAEFDADKNGSLSLPEFEALWADITKPIAVRAFQFLDPDGDAAVAKAELDERFGDGRQPLRPERRRRALPRGSPASWTARTSPVALGRRS